MTKTKSGPLPSGVFLPGDDLMAYFDRHGDVGAMFDRVHAHFFDSLGRQEITVDRQLRKGGRHDQSHSR
ncbi:MAG: hypothetical protein IPN19_09065 [Elusimicrobia bacterium]|nr:hypothetical protein [Elusimicrobiota bacterium]